MADNALIEDERPLKTPWKIGCWKLYTYNPDDRERHQLSTLNVTRVANLHDRPAE